MNARPVAYAVAVAAAAALVHFGAPRTIGDAPGSAAVPAPTSEAAPPPTTSRRLTGVTALAAAPDRVVVGDAVGRLYEARADAPPWFAAHDAAIRRVWLRADGGFGTASADGSVGLWAADGALRKRLRLPEGHLNDTVADGDTVYVAADRGTVARLCEPAPCWTRLGAHGAAAYAIALSPDRTELVSAGMDGRVAVRSTATGDPRLDWANGAGWVTALVWLAEGIYAGDRTGQVTLWPGATLGSSPRRVDVGAAPVVAVAAAEGWLYVGTEDGVLAAISRIDGRRGPTARPGSAVRALAIGAGEHPSGPEGVLLVGCADGAIRRYRPTPAALVPMEPLPIRGP